MTEAAPTISGKPRRAAALTLLTVIALAVVGMAGFAMGPTAAIAAAGGLLLVTAVWYWPHLGAALMIIVGVGIPSLVSKGAVFPISVTQVLAILTIAGGGHWMLSHKIKPTYSPHFVWAAAFMAMTGVSLLIQPDFDHSKIGTFDYFRSGIFILVIASLAVTRSSFTACLYALIGAVTLCSILGTAEAFVPGFHIPSMDDEQNSQTGAAVSPFSLEDNTTVNRVSGGTGSYNWLAYTVAIGMPLNLYWWYRTRTNFMKACVLAATMFQFIALVFTYTRSGFIGLGAAVLFLVWKRRIPVWLPTTAIIAAILTSPFWLPPRFVDRMLSVKYLQAGTTTIRKEFLYVGCQMILEKPVFGWGYAQFGPYFMSHSKDEVIPRMREEIEKGAGEENDIRPHNIYIDLGCDYGIIGLLVFGGFMIWMYRDLREVTLIGSPSDRLLANTLQAAIIAFLVCGFFGNIEIIKIPWAISGLVGTLRRVAYQDAGLPVIANMSPGKPEGVE